MFQAYEQTPLVRTPSVIFRMDQSFVFTKDFGMPSHDYSTASGDV